jgi:NAD(P)-dependent dehydrogenase (short-subunit alcohol dehydrogenase family)
MAYEAGPYRMVDTIHQSKPIDLTAPYDSACLEGKTILITGGASGIGEGLFKHWASKGANVTIGDINIERGLNLVREVRQLTGNKDLHFVHCDVTDWESQVHMFKEAVRHSSHGGIDTVVANAGILEKSGEFESPVGLDAPSPPKPNLLPVKVNLIGTLYTAHLAMFYLPRNPEPTPSSSLRDRHLLLLGSMASLLPIPGQPLYGVSKHGVLGLFRNLRATSFVSRVRVNLLCPYCIDTPLVGAAARILFAGGVMGTLDDLVDAGTRLVADSSISGRSLVVGPKLKIEEGADGEWHLVAKESSRGNVVAMWEAYANDFEDTEVFARRMIRLLNAVVWTKGWIGWVVDVVRALMYKLGIS